MRLARIFQAIGDLVDGSLGSVRSVCIADLEFSSAILLRARADLCQENEATHITGQSDPRLDNGFSSEAWRQSPACP